MNYGSEGTNVYVWIMNVMHKITIKKGALFCHNWIYK